MGKRTEEPSGLGVGDVVYMARFVQRGEIMPGTYFDSTVKAKKGTVLVALLIGEQPISGGAEVDPIKVMRELGWQPISR